jgi:hypothetical protein
MRLTRGCLLVFTIEADKNYYFQTYFCCMIFYISKVLYKGVENVVMMFYDL